MSKPYAFISNGPPGLAKTGFQLQKIKHRIMQGRIKARDVLIVVFSKKKAEEIKRKLREMNNGTNSKYSLSAIRVKTLHAYAVMRSKANGDYFGKYNYEDKQLRMLQNPDQEMEIQAEAMDLHLEFSRIIKQFAEDLANERLQSRKKYKLIVVDELQVLNMTMVRCLIGLLRENNFPELLLSGDAYQDLFFWAKTKEEEMNAFRDLLVPLGEYYDLKFPKLDYRRGGPGLANFFNGFEKILGTNVVQNVHKSVLRKAAKAPELYFQMPRLILEQDKTRQIRRLENEVRELRAKYPNDSILIIGRNRWIGIDRTEDVEKGFKTLHTALGTEADHVIWADFSNGESPGQLPSIIRVAISRAKKTLAIISTDPEKTATQWFEPGTFELINNQRRTPVTRTKKSLKHIRKDCNQSLKKNTVIDSIDCRVGHDAAPFHLWLSHNHGKKQDTLITHETKYQTLKLRPGTTIEDIPTYCIRLKIYKNGKRSYKFQFRSLNFLRRNGYSDRDILDAVKNEISYWFEGRVDMEQVEISRIDLAGLYICDENQKKLLVHRLAYSVAISNRFEKRSICTFNESGHKFLEMQPDSHSVYVNYGNVKAGITLLGYDPSKKPENDESRDINIVENRLSQKKYHRNDLFKIEIKVHGKTVSSRIGTNSLAELYERTDSLTETYRKLSQNMGIMDGDRVLGLECSEKSWGVFEVKKSVNLDGELAETTLNPIPNTAISANYSSPKRTLSSGWGGIATISATEFLRRYL